MSVQVPDQRPGYIPARRDTIGDSIGQLSQLLAGPQREQQAQQDDKAQKAKARAAALSAKAAEFKLDPNQWRELRSKVVASDPEVAPYLPDVPEVTPNAEQNLHNMKIADETTQFPNIPESARRQGTYQDLYKAPMPAESVKLGNLQDVTSNPDRWSSVVQDQQRIEGKTAQSANEKVTAAEIARHNKAEEGISRTKAATSAAGGAGASDKAAQADAIAQAIIDGKQPPELSKLYGLGGPVRASLASKGYDLTRATQDWTATQKHIATLNGPQQTRLRQAVDAAYNQLDVIEGLYNDWQKVGSTSGIRVFNKASLTAAKNLPGEAGAAAQALDGQIALAAGEFGQVLMGGNSPTDHALQLGAKMLQGDWNDQTFKKALKQLRIDFKIRQNSLTNAGVAGASEGNTYAQPAPGGGKEIHYDEKGNRIQ